MAGMLSYSLAVCMTLIQSRQFRNKVSVVMKSVQCNSTKCRTKEIKKNVLSAWLSCSL